jgi:hypothetical protein
MPDNVADRVQKQIDSLRGIDWEQYTTQEDDTSSLSFFSGILLGMIVGVIVAIMLAPQSGSDTREQVIQTGIELMPNSDDEESETASAQA